MQAGPDQKNHFAAFIDDMSRTCGYITMNHGEPIRLVLGTCSRVATSGDARLPRLAGAGREDRNVVNEQSNDPVFMSAAGFRFCPEIPLLLTKTQQST